MNRAGTHGLRLAVRVKPGSSRPRVGGEYDGSLVVSVSERAVGGRATEAALTALATAFGVRRWEVRLVQGAASRSKLVEITGDPEHLARTREKLLSVR